jgi:hypothetical protein
VPGVGVGQQPKLLDRDWGAHQRHGRDTEALQVDRYEEAFDDDQMSAALLAVPRIRL